MKSGRYVLAAVAMTCAWAAGGCGGEVFKNPQQQTIEREVNLDGRTAVVIPFQEKGGAYYGSADGTELAERLTKQMTGNMPKTKFASPLPTREMIEKSTTAPTPVELGKAAGADVVITGNMTEFRTEEPKTQGILMGRCIAQVTVYDVKAGKTMKAWTVTAQYPERGAGIPETDMDKPAMRDALLKRSADVIAKKFYTWEKNIGVRQVEW